MKKERKAWSDVLLEEDLSHRDKLPAGEDFWEQNNNVIIGESQGNDVLVVPCAFRMGGTEPGVWRVDDGMVQLTALVIVPHDQRGKMRDNDFICNRQDPVESTRDFQVAKEGDRVIWKVGNRQYISRPPYWEVKGEHIGVSCDVIMGGLGPCTRYLGPWSELAASGRASYDQACWAEGAITAGGKTYPLEKAFAVHDQVMLGKDWANLPGLFGERGSYYYIWGLSESIQTFQCIVNLAGTVIPDGSVHIDGRMTNFGRGEGEVAVNEQEWWVDPRTGMYVPVRWHINMNSKEGVLDMNVAAAARSFWGVQWRTGNSMHYSMLCHSNGRFFSPDGGNLSIQDMLTYVEWGSIVMPLEA